MTAAVVCVAERILRARNAGAIVSGIGQFAAGIAGVDAPSISCVRRDTRIPGFARPTRVARIACVHRAPRVARTTVTYQPRHLVQASRAGKREAAEERDGEPIAELA